MKFYDRNASSDWDADVDYDRRIWISERKAELVADGYHPATAHIVATREWSEQEGLL